MIKQNKRSLKSSLKKTSKISTSVKNTKFEKSYIATKKFANVKKMIINYLTNADSNAKKAEQLKFQSNESKQKAVADLYIYSTTIVTKEDLKSEISNIIKNIFAEITNKNILRFQQKLTFVFLLRQPYQTARLSSSLYDNGSVTIDGYKIPISYHRTCTDFINEGLEHHFP